MITITLRQNRTGRTVDVQDEYYSSWEDAEFWWTEGNGSCDCNRRLAWARTKHPKLFSPQACDVECSEWRYTIVAVNGEPITEHPQLP